MLYEKNTYQPTARLRALVAEEETPTTGDIAELWQVYAEGEVGWGSGQPTLSQFAQWLTATGDYANVGVEPCEVAW